MSCDTIRYRVVQNPENKFVELQIYRNYGTDTDQWVMVDKFNEMTSLELKCLADHIYSLCKKK
jgi:hypothetical protein